jgi:large subunit ribosomal protein L9
MLEVILTKDVDNLGNAGEIVRVRPGYGRNYLIPRGLALVATRGNISQLEHHKRSIASQQARIRSDYEKLAEKLKSTSVSIARKAGKDNRLFGSVGSRDIVEALAMQNIELDRKLIQLDEPIRDVGPTEVMVRFTSDISVALKVTVVGI